MSKNNLGDAQVTGASSGIGGAVIDEITRIAVIAYIKAALTLRDPRNFLFFPRTPDGKRAAKDFLAD